MLKSLSIKNFAVIDSLQIEFNHCLNIFTGETGAGKSILIEALGFALGSRAVSDFLRPGAPRLEVTAVFDVSRLDRGTRKRFSLAGPEAVFRREMDSKGKGRAFLNGAQTPVSVLAELGDFLVDFHGQHEHQTLVKPALHLSLLDRFARLESETARIGETYRSLKSARSRLEAVKMSEEEKARLLDLYRFQLKEIEEAALKPGEDQELEALLPRLRNTGKLREISEEAYRLLYADDGSASGKTGKALKKAEELASLDDGAADILDLLRQAEVNLSEACARLSSYKEGISLDPEQLDSLLARQEKIALLKKKYGPEIKDIIAFGETLRGKTADLETSGEKEQELKESAIKLEKLLAGECEKLHELRAGAARDFSKKVLQEIKPLGFANVKFSVSVEMEDGGYSETGADSVEFLFSANPGQPLRPLRSIASGGEMARLMLGLKTVLASADNVGVLVFDEVDAGVGAVVGRLVGEKLSGLAEGKQVLCVTHMPQVAAFGEAHFRISKEVKGDSTFARADRLEAGARVGEIAGMLGGKRESSDLSRRHAEELLSECGNNKKDGKKISTKTRN